MRQKQNAEKEIQNLGNDASPLVMQSMCFIMADMYAPDIYRQKKLMVNMFTLK